MYRVDVDPIHTVIAALQLRVVDRDDLIDPADEGGDLDVDAGHVLTAAPEAPADEAGQLVEALLVLAHQRTASVTLRDYLIMN